MKTIALGFLAVLLIFTGFYLSGCSDDSPVSTVLPPVTPKDTNEFANLRDKLPFWIIENKLYQVKAINDKIWITTSVPFMYFSQDSGKNFTKTNLLNILPVINMYPDGINGWNAGENLLKTSNSGLNWTYSAVSLTVYDVYFLNSNTGFLLGKQNTTMLTGKTTNGGLNWSYQNIIFEGSSPLYLSGFCFPDSTLSSRIFIGTSHGVYKSTNSGVNWNPVNFPITGSPAVIQIYMQSKNKMWVCGKNGFLALYSGNDVWKVTPLNNSEDELTGISFAKDGLSGWITTDKNFVFQTTDGGNNWRKRYYGQNFAGSLNSVYTVSDKEAYFVGDACMFFKYTKK
jgi:photosystem II stability/assembly factor-like uncharacterized protein